ncbi:MAG: FlgD immunoglobulin-like domain containing protein [Candidatus Eisenbacteria bacterium]
MRLPPKFPLALGCTLLVACATWAPAVRAQMYEVHDLGTLGGVRGSGAAALSGNGRAVGYSFITGANFVHAMLNDHGVVSDLGTLGGTQSLARAVNASGVVVGWAYPFGVSVQRAFRWQDGVMTDLGTFGGNVGDAQDVNDAGIIVGSAFTVGVLERAFWWDGTLHDLGTLGGSQARAYAINSWNDIVGWASPESDDRFHAFLGKPGSELYDLGTLGGQTSHAYDVNENTHVCGWTQISFTLPDSRGFFWANGVMKSVGTAGGIYSAAFALNDYDEVVGATTREDGTTVAFLWKNDHLYDLNLMIPAGSDWVLERAWDIDEAGAIVGEGMLAGVPRAFLLTPAQASGVPEGGPGTGTRFAGAFPNPARGPAEFRFALERAGEVRLQVFDVSGRLLRTLGPFARPAGAGAVAWDGRDATGAAPSPGLYFARLEAAGRTFSRSFVLAR